MSRFLCNGAELGTARRSFYVSLFVELGVVVSGGLVRVVLISRRQYLNNVDISNAKDPKTAQAAVDIQYALLGWQLVAWTVGVVFATISVIPHAYRALLWRFYYRTFLNETIIDYVGHHAALMVEGVRTPQDLQRAVAARKKGSKDVPFFLKGENNPVLL
ncbi:hypothetical protein HDU76_003665 [Blyttiomyces sp. JEL0837]|nr:hypothetical protein HDU76_003665 [Blyttiomyces sp. JEL0837]